jgi:hypothetical protein
MENSTIRSISIKNDLKKFAIKNGLKSEELNYDILKVSYFEKITKEDKTDYKAIIFSPKTNYQNNIIQKYTIQINSNKKSYFKECCSIKVNKNKTKVILHINNFELSKTKNSDINLKTILEDINKIKAEHGILLKFFQPDISTQILDFLKKAKVQSSINNYKITVFDSTKSVYTKRGYILKNSFKDHCDSFVTPIETGELIATYKKPTNGINSINAIGQIFDQSKLDSNQIYKYTNDQVSITEDENTISMFSKINGFIMILDNEIKINNKVSTKSLIGQKFNVISSNSHNINLDIIHSKDNPIAVEDVLLEAKEIKIVGDIGKNVKIKSHKTTIDGECSSDLYIESRILKANTFNGKFKGDTIQINCLEGGEVLANRVYIKNLKNSFIKAESVNINNTLSESQISVGKELRIDSINSNNTFYIKNNKKNQDKINSHKEHLETIDLNIEKKSKQLKELDSFIKNNQESIKKIKKYINKCKKDGVAFSISVLEKSKNFDNKVKLLTITNQHLKTLINTKIKIVNEINNFKSEIPEVLFESKNGWDGNSFFKQKLFLELDGNTHIFELNKYTPNKFNHTFIKDELLAQAI